MSSSIALGKIPQKLVGRPFDYQTLQIIQQEIQQAKPFNRAEIARRVCKRLDWKSPGGNYQWMSTRVALLSLDRSGLIHLPQPTKKNSNGLKLKLNPVSLLTTEPLSLSVHQLHGLKLEHVQNKQQSTLYHQLMEHYHYLGHTMMAGAQIRYIFSWDQGLLGAIGFGASAWKIASRDTWIGWSPEIREKNLHLIINNSRFLILPWIHSKNLASKILSLCARRLTKDFAHLYGYTPVLLETFVECSRFRGDCYRAANWKCLGQTKGRGKKHRNGQAFLPIKDIWVYPLSRHFRSILQKLPDN